MKFNYLWDGANLSERITEEDYNLIKSLYSKLNLDENTIDYDYSIDYLTINTGRDGKTYAYYLDETREAAVSEDGEIVTDTDRLTDLF